MRQLIMDKQASALDLSPIRVLIVDDDADHRKLEKYILEEPEYEIVEATNGADALVAIKEREFDVVLLDRRMPGMDGDEVCRRIRDQEGIHLLPVILVTGDDPHSIMTESLNGYANDFITKPYSPDELIARVNAAAIMKRRTDRLEDIEAVLYALARMVEAKDGNTGDHCSRLMHVCTVFGKTLGLTMDEIMALRRGGILHDIGKLGIPDRILLKQGQLTEDEMVIMRQHTIIGYELCNGLKTLKSTLPIIRNHHEKYDGSGYPDGLAGEEIPLLARIFQIADIYDALLYRRPYKAPIPIKQVKKILEREVENGWRDPGLVSVFIRLINERPDDFLPPEANSHSDGIQIFEKIMAIGALRNFD